MAPHHTEGNGKILESGETQVSAPEENTHQIDLLEAGPYPTELLVSCRDSKPLLSGNTYAAFEGSSIDLISTQLAYSVGSVLMSVHLDERETTIGLESRLNHVAKVLEERHKV